MLKFEEVLRIGVLAAHPLRAYLPYHRISGLVQTQSQPFQTVIYLFDTPYFLLLPFLFIVVFFFFVFFVFFRFLVFEIKIFFAPLAWGGGKKKGYLRGCVLKFHEVVWVCAGAF